MNVFTLEECEKPLTEEARSVLLSNGLVLNVWKGMIWREDEVKARRVTTDVSFSNIEYSSTLRATLVTFDGFSGVFAFRSSTGQGIPFTLGRLPTGIRVAQPIKTNGPRMTCLAISTYRVCAGDAWGAVAIWDLEQSVTDPPRWVFGAHGKEGVRTATLVDDDTLLTTGGDSNEIKLWRLGNDGRPKFEALFVTKDQQRLSTKACLLSSPHSHHRIVCCGTRTGQILFWAVSEDAAENQPLDPLSLDALNGKETRNIDVVDNLVFVCANDGRLVIIDVRSSGTLRVIAIRRLKKPFIGLHGRRIVLDATATVKIQDVIRGDRSEAIVQSSSQEDILIDDVDLQKAIHFFMQTPATARVATRRVLNRPLGDNTTFGTDLIPIDPIRKRNTRICCVPDGFKKDDEPIWVKRRVRGPKIDPTKRKPLYPQPSNSVSPVNLVPSKIPPFCRIRSRTHDEPDLYAKEGDGDIHVTLTLDE